MKKIRWFVLAVALLALAMLVGCGGGEQGNSKDAIRVTWYRSMNGDGTPVVAMFRQSDLQSGRSFLNPTTLPSVTGYRFSGLYDAVSGGTQIVTPEGELTVSLSKDTVLYAQWEPLLYTVEFDSRGGSFSGNVQKREVAYGTVIGTMPIPQKEGYRFLGWTNQSGDLISNEFGSALDRAETLTEQFYPWNDQNQIILTAKYEVIQLKITFEYQDGTYRNEQRSIPYGETPNPDSFPVPDPTEGMEFVGWSTIPDELHSEFSTVTENLTLYGIWRQYRTVKIYLDPNGESVQLRLYKGASSEIKLPVRAGYSIEGFYRSSTFSGNPIGTPTFESSPDVLYLKWKVVTYTVRFETGTNERLADLDYTVEGGVALPSPKRSNYIFLGWCRRQDCTDTPILEIPKGMIEVEVLYAKYRGEDRTILLNAGEGSLSDKELSVEYGAAYTLPVPVLNGYVFIGWFTGPDGTGTRLTDKNGNGSSPWNDTNSSTTVYAAYRKKVYVNIQITPDGAGRVDVGSYYYSGETVTLTVTVNDGYRIIGWFLNGESVCKTERYSFTVGEETLSLELRLEAKSYTVTLNPGQGFCAKQQVTVVYGQSFVLPAAYCANFTFTGWYDGQTALTDKDGNSLADWSITRNVTLTANYVAATDANEILVWNVDTLLTMRERPNATYVLVPGVELNLSGIRWEPFDFSGKLIGNGCTICNLTVKGQNGNLGMFLKLSGTVQDVIFENLTVSSTANENEAVWVGGVCALLTGTLRNVTVTGSLTGDFCRIGGLVGKVEGGTVEGCINRANVSSKTLEGAVSAGGIAGCFQGGAVRSCENYGNISIGSYCGGVIGWSITTGATNLVNYGKVVGSQKVGGVIGIMSQQGSYIWAADLTNYGTVTGSHYVGGCVGWIYQDLNADGVRTVKISKMFNYGTVTGDGTLVGGCIGEIFQNAYMDWRSPSILINVFNLENKGDVTGKNYVGGVVGKIYTLNSGSTLSGCISSGTITAEALVGGIVGYLHNTAMSDCSNDGTTIKATGYITDGSSINAFVGGYIGQAGGNCSIKNCHNKIDILYEEAGQWVGGVCGFFSGLRAENCSNTGNISAPKSRCVGGILGELCGKGEPMMSELTNSGNIIGRNSVGGISGAFYDDWNVDSNGYYALRVTKLVNSGNVVATSDYAGGCIGFLYANAYYNYRNPQICVTISGAISTGNVTGKTFVGGIVGYALSDCADSKLTDCSAGGTVTAEAKVGGIAGQLNRIALLDCSNEGMKVVATGYITEGTNLSGYIGGFAGYVYDNNVQNCTNHADIQYSSIGNYVGGIVGYMAGSMLNCQNGVNITAPKSNYVGGLAGCIEAWGSITIENNINGGTVTGNNYVGGIAGRVLDDFSHDSNTVFNIKLNKLTNTGNITGKQFVAGVIGHLHANVAYSYRNPSVLVMATELTNAGSITGTGTVAALIGYISTDNISSSLTIYSNTGLVNGNATSGKEGLIAEMNNFTIND